MLAKEASYVKCKVDATGAPVDHLAIHDKHIKFNVILQSFERAADVSDLDADEKLERAQAHKERGTELFRQERVHFAQKRYSKALGIIANVHEESSSMSDLAFAEELRGKCSTLKIQCFINLAACHLRCERYSDVIDTCSSAIELDAKTVKAFFRRGQAHLNKHQYVEAKSDFEKVLQLEPNNKAAQNQLNVVTTAIKKEKQMYHKMFN